MRTILVWLERALFTLGAALAVWCTIVLVRAEYVRRIPVPAPSAHLPGDAGDGGTSPRVPAKLPSGSWIARLEAPTADLVATVLEGSDDGTLARAAGHIEDTAFPGQQGNIGIAGHRDTIFRPVRKLSVGDPIVLTTADNVYRYRVARTMIVGPNDVWVLDPGDHPTLTLVTCYPFEFFGHAPKRFIVSADLVGGERRAAS
jgi:sortase A